MAAELCFGKYFFKNKGKDQEINFSMLDQRGSVLSQCASYVYNGLEFSRSAIKSIVTGPNRPLGKESFS
jgi:hypothetical protein